MKATGINILKILNKKLFLSPVLRFVQWYFKSRIYIIKRYVKEITSEITSPKIKAKQTPSKVPKGKYIFNKIIIAIIFEICSKNCEATVL